MIRDLSSIGLAFLCATSLGFSQQLNVLVIGSTHSYSERGESGGVHEMPFNPAAITAHLQGIIFQDLATMPMQGGGSAARKFLRLAVTGN